MTAYEAFLFFFTSNGISTKQNKTNKQTNQHHIDTNKQTNKRTNKQASKIN